MAKGWNELTPAESPFRFQVVGYTRERSGRTRYTVTLTNYNNSYYIEQSKTKRTATVLDHVLPPSQSPPEEKIMLVQTQ